MLHDRLDDVRHRIQQAAWRSGRDPSSVTVICVTKGIAVDTIQQVLALGVIELGENKVQEAEEKQRALGLRLPAASCMQPGAGILKPVRWHFIGHLQRNKAKDAIELFDVIHSIDSLALIDELERRAASCRPQAAGKSAPLLEAFVQINISREATKFGCQPQSVIPLVKALIERPHLRFCGLMTMAPFTEDPEYARPHFRHLRLLRDDVVAACSLQLGACSLSMGMSHDFEVAIEEGTDIIRIGTAIFGT